MPYCTEEARKTEIIEETEVLVCGAGPAGVAAAVAAARAGARTRLLEAYGQLGGIWTTGLLSWIIDAKNKGGVMQEIVERVEEMGGRSEAYGRNMGSIGYAVETMKLALDQLCLEAGVQIRLHTRAVAAVIEEDNRVSCAITESKSGREAWRAKYFVDCTGDGDLAALAGCGFDYGRPAHGPGAEGPERVGETQPMSLMCLVTGLDPEATAAVHDRVNQPWAAPKDNLLAEIRRAGLEPSYGRPTVFRIHDDLYAWMINHEYGVSGLDAQQTTDATLRARAEVHQLIEGLRSLGDPWRDVRIVATAGQIGVREGRRIHGRYAVSFDDMLEGRRHEDAACPVTFGLDVHSTSKAHSTGIEGRPPRARTQPYDIPLRALIAEDVDGLLMAGRCISGDFLAHSSYRVTGDAVAMGESAGTVAALAATSSRQPHEVPWEEAKAVLEGAV